MRISPAPFAAPSVSIPTTPFAAPTGGHPVPPKDGTPKTDAERIRATIAFTQIIGDEVQTSLKRFAESGVAAAAQWVEFSQQNFETIYRFALDTPAMAERGVAQFALDSASLAWELARDSAAGDGTDTFAGRIAVLAARAEALREIVLPLADG